MHYNRYKKVINLGLELTCFIILLFYLPSLSLQKGSGWDVSGMKSKEGGIGGGGGGEAGGGGREGGGGEGC